MPLKSEASFSFSVRDSQGAFDTTANVVTLALHEGGTSPFTIQVSGSTLGYTEGATATTVDAGVTITSINPSLVILRATATIDAGLQAGDTLSFVSTGPITGSYDANTATLTLTGAATAVDYQAALRTLRFQSSQDNPSPSKAIVLAVFGESGSTAVATRAVAVTGINDAPELRAGGGLSYTENDPASVIAAQITVTDVDSSDFSGGSLTVAFSANGAPQDQLAVHHQGTAAGQIGVSGTSLSYGGATIGTLSGGMNGADLVISFTGAAATQAAVQALAQNITYASSSEAPSTRARSVSFTLVDGDGGTQGGMATVTIELTAINDAPTAETSHGATTYTEGDGAVAVDASIDVADPDSTTLFGATVKITGGYLEGSDVLAFAGTAGTGNIAAGAFDAATGMLALTSPDATATHAHWEAALAAVTFDTSSVKPGAWRTVSFQLNDGQGANNLSGLVAKTIAITELNSAPVVTTTGGSTAFVEGAGAVAVDEAIDISDADTASLTGASASITGNFSAAADVLSFTPVGSISGSYNATTGVLGLSGTGTLAEYEQALASITYNNTGHPPGTATRTITFKVNDGQSSNNLSNGATRTVTVAAAYDGPSITAGTTLGYTEDDPARVIAPTATVFDPDAAAFVGGTLAASFTANGTAADQLAVRHQGTGAGQIGVSGTDISFGGVTIGTTSGGSNGSNLVIAFTTALATPAAVQALVRNITFANTSEDPSATARTVQFTLAEGGGGDTASASATVIVTNVNDAPAIGGGAGSTLGYTENAPATTIDGALTLSDVDGTTLNAATVRISANYQSGQDLLAFAPVGNITGSFDTVEGVLTLSGTDTLANYQAAMRSVTYANASESPSALTRTVSFQVDDGGAVNDLSNSLTRDISVAPVNDLPVLTAGGTLSYTENDAATPIQASLTLVHAEGDAITGATVAITANFASGQDALAFAPTAGITGNYNAATGVLSLSGSGSAAEYDTALSSVTYANSSQSPSSLARTITFQVTDSAGDTGTATATVTVATVNDAPVNTVPSNAGIGTAFSNTAMSISGVSIADVDAGGGTMTVEVTAANGGLTFSLAGGATVSAGANGASSVTLGGTATQLNAALATLSYKSDDGFTGSDTITVVTSDGGNTGGGVQTDSDSFQVGVVPQVFFIDNTDATADSASAGTAANPFNSLASFNTHASDGAGDYIYLQQGSGTYSEASGLTLLNDQQVYGQGQTLQFTNPVTGSVVTVGIGTGATTPTLVIAGASQTGVTLAQGNTLTGFNIVTTGASQTGIADGGGSVGSLTVSDVDVTGTGMALDIDQGGVLNVAFGTLSSSGSDQQGVQLAGSTLSGSFSASAGTISGSTGTGFLVGDASGTANTGGTVSIDYAGAIGTTGTARAVDIQDRGAGAGTITLSGPIMHSGGNASGIVIDDIAGGAITLSGSNTLNTGTSTAVLITDVTGGSVTFSGNQDIDTTSGTGILLSGSSQAVSFTGAQITVNTTTGSGVVVGNSGTVTFDNSGNGLDIVTTGGTGLLGTSGTLAITGSGNTVAVTNGVGVNLGHTTIGGAGVSFVSVSASGGAHGIVLNNTGAGGFSVTGDGTGARNASGGTIQNTTDDGISLTDASNVTLNSMSVTSAGDTVPATLADAASAAGDHGVYVSGGSNFVFSGLLVDAPSGSGVLLLNIGGTNRINSDSLITNIGGIGYGLYAENTNVNMTLLQLDDITMSNNASATANVFVANTGTASFRFDVRDSTFENLAGQAITAAAGGTGWTTGTLMTSLLHNVFQNAMGSGENNVGILVNNGATHTAQVDDNTFQNIAEDGSLANTSIIRTQNNGGVLNATVTHNTIQNIDYATGGRHVIGHVFEPAAYSNGYVSNLNFSNNTVSNVTYAGGTHREFVFVDFRADAGGGDVIVAGNDIFMASGGTQQGIELRLRQIHASTVDVQVANNTGSFNTSGVLIDIDAEAAATVNATVTGNAITNANGAPGAGLGLASEGSSTSTLNANVTGNTFLGGIDLAQTGTLAIQASSQGELSTTNNAAAVTASTGTPTYNGPSVTLPDLPPVPLALLLAASPGSDAGLPDVDGTGSTQQLMYGLLDAGAPHVPEIEPVQLLGSSLFDAGSD